MRLLATFIALAALILLIWIIWGGAWESHFTLAGATSWLQQAGPWAWSAGIGLLAADLVLPIPGTLVGEKTARKLLGDRDFEKGRLLFARGGGYVIALSRAIPILPEALSCTAGLVRMPFHAFLTSLACGSIPVGFLFAWIGAVGRETPAWAIAFSIGVPVLLWLLARRLSLG
jgi:uncharacterized membrane protein YdjX (TVP38/TMEM64 family)